MLTYDLFVALILFSTLAPIVGVIALLVILSFEREMDVLKGENKRVRLEEELRHSEYLQLNQQIQPHFLFNSINLLLGLARLQKTDQLIKTLEHLSKYLKFKYQVNQQLIPFKKELDYSRNYLGIQKIRFNDRLSVSIHVEGPQADDALIPPYLLQTLVENAFKHGLEKKIGRISLGIQFHHTDKEAILKVSDNGLGLKNVPFNIEDSSGHGLKNINKRLFLLFHDQYQLKINPAVSGGTAVEVSWPLMALEGEEIERIDGR